MNDHLIAEANRHAMTLPTTHPTHADIAWYVREVDQLSAEVKSLREWQQEVIQNAWAHKATVETAIARAERAEAEVKRLGHLEAVLRSSAADMTAGSITAGGVADLRAEVERLKSDGAASVFVNMSCRASRAETERNNLRADLDAIKAILTEEKDRAERAEAELATERARMDAVVENCWLVHKGNENMFAVFSHVCGDYITPWVGTERAAIDAAMKEETK